MKRIALLLFCLSSLAWGQNSRYDSVALGPKGPIPAATIAVCTQPANTSTQPCTPLASLCSSLTDTTCTSPNPLTADSLGNFRFYSKQAQAPFTVQIYGPQVASPLALSDQQPSVSTSGNNIFIGTNTLPNLNNIIYVDGTKYAFTAVGVQAAINAACNGTLLGIVVITPGVIPLATTGVTVPNNCDVGGTGQAATKLTFTSGATTSLFANAATSPANIRIHDLTMDGGSSTSVSEGCIGMNQVTAPTDITIEHVTCQNVGGSGLNVSGTAANPGNRVKFISNKVISAGLVCPGSGCVAAGQIYGILASFNSHLAAIDNEITGGGVTLGIGAFSSINASSATPIVDVQYIGNRIHDIAFNSTPGAAMDIGRARQAVAASNVVYNLAQGGCVFFESVWGGSISGNTCSVADAVLTGGPIVVKIPDTTQAGEVASQDISIVGNSIIDNSAVATVNGGITVNGAQRNISIKGNSLSYLNQATNSPSGIFLQLGTNDSNISGASQNFCNGIVVEGNTITNRPGTGSATIVGINLQQLASGCIDDQIVISNNVVLSTNVGIKFTGTAASNGITHAYILGNSVDTATTGLTNDAKTYTSVFTANNSTAAPTISSGFGTSPSIVTNNGTFVFTLNVGTGGTATSGVIGLPTALTGWSCEAIDRNTNIVTRETATTTATVTLTAASAWTASDILQVKCAAY